MFVGAERNERSHKNASVDFVYKRFKAKTYRHSNALVKGFPTPPSSCLTDTGLLRSVYLPSVDAAQSVVLFSTPARERAQAHTGASTHECACFPICCNTKDDCPTTNVRGLLEYSFVSLALHGTTSSGSTNTHFLLHVRPIVYPTYFFDLHRCCVCCVFVVCGGCVSSTPSSYVAHGQ